MLLIFCITIIVIYLILIAWLNRGFDKVETFKLKDLAPTTKFSVIIPFRNEAANLPELLESLKNLNYPKAFFEVILVNDDSTDNWENTLNTFRHKYRNTPIDNIRVTENIRSTKSPKKDAITSAICISKYNWIITTDADCILPKYWLDSYDEYIQTFEPNAVAGPVRFNGTSSFFNRFQIIDTLSLQGVTIGGFGIGKPFMCNGANFAYSKTAFNHVKGFYDNSDVASGDDVFLLQKLITSENKKVHFLKSKKAIVSTKVSNGLKKYVHQRLRWASKSSKYILLFPKVLGVVILLTNCLIIGLIPLYLAGLLSLKNAVLVFIIKFSIDLLIIFKTARFCNQESVLLSYVFASLIHPFITVYIALRSPFSKFEWKDRAFKS